MNTVDKVANLLAMSQSIDLSFIATARAVDQEFDSDLRAAVKAAVLWYRELVSVTGALQESVPKELDDLCEWMIF